MPSQNAGFDSQSNNQGFNGQGFEQALGNTQFAEQTAAQDLSQLAAAPVEPAQDFSSPVQLASNDQGFVPNMQTTPEGFPSQASLLTAESAGPGVPSASGAIEGDTAARA